MELEADLRVRTLLREWMQMWDDPEPDPFILEVDDAAYSSSI